jgi:hypothetical protein
MILENKEQGVATNTEQGVATNTEQGVATPCSENYNDHGFCSARLTEFPGCVNFDLVPKTNRLCAHLNLGGACDTGKQKEIEK